MRLERQVSLCVRSGPASGRAFRLNDAGVTLIGRDLSNHIVLRHRGVSANHCLLVPSSSQQGFVLVDVRSRRGTLINGRRLSKGIVSVGDVITVGPFELELTETPPAEPIPCPARPAAGQPAQFEIAPRRRRAERHSLRPASALVLGRADCAHIRVDDPFASEFHCLIALDPNDEKRVPFLIDLRSENGTYVNNRRIHRKHLHPGDDLRIGQARFRLRRLKAPEPEVPEPGPEAPRAGRPAHDAAALTPSQGTSTPPLPASAGELPASPTVTPTSERQPPEPSPRDAPPPPEEDSPVAAAPAGLGLPTQSGAPELLSAEALTMPDRGEAVEPAPAVPPRAGASEERAEAAAIAGSAELGGEPDLLDVQEAAETPEAEHLTPEDGEEPPIRDETLLTDGAARPEGDADGPVDLPAAEGVEVERPEPSGRATAQDELRRHGVEEGLLEAHRAPAPWRSRAVRLLRRRLVVGTLVFLVSAPAVVALVCWRIQPRFRAEALLQVRPVRSRALAHTAGTPEDAYGTFFRTQLAVAKSDAVLRRCLTGPSFDDIPLLASAEDPLEALRSALEVRRAPGTQLFTIAALGRDPRGLSTLVNAVAESHLAHLEEAENSRRDSARQRLVAEKTKLEGEVKTRVAALTQLRAAAADLEAGVGRLGRDRLIITQKALLDRRAKHASLTSKLNAVQSSLAASGLQVSSARIDELLRRDQEFQRQAALRNQLRGELLLAEAEAASPSAAAVAAGVAQDPKIVELEREIERKERQVATLSQAREDGSSSAPTPGSARVPSDLIAMALADDPEAQRLAARIRLLRQAIARELKSAEAAAANAETRRDARQRAKELDAQRVTVEKEILPYRERALRSVKAALEALRARFVKLQRELKGTISQKLRDEARERAKELRTRLKLLKKHEEESRARTRRQIIERLKNEARAKMREKVKELESELAACDAAQGVLKAMLATQKEQRTIAERAAARLKALEEDLGRTRDAVLRVQQALLDLETAPAAPGHVSIVSPAKAPPALEPYAARRVKYSVLGLAGAAALALLVALLVGRRDGRPSRPGSFLRTQGIAVRPGEAANQAERPVQRC